jgi:peptidoglycan/LPS O-acetylase OafA/YrhL
MATEQNVSDVGCDPLIIVARAWGASLFPPYPAFAGASYAAVPLAGAIAVLTALGNNVPAMILSSVPFRIIGTLSYSIYVVHLTAIDLARGLRSDLLIFNMAALGITVLLGAALYFIIERPALRLRHRLPPNAAGPLPIIASVGAVSVGLAIIVWRAFNS